MNAISREDIHQNKSKEQAKFLSRSWKVLRNTSVALGLALWLSQSSLQDETFPRIQYDILSYSSDLPIVFVPKNISEKTRADIREVLEHSLSHYPKGMPERYVSFIFFHEDLRNQEWKTLAGFMEWKKKSMDIRIKKRIAWENPYRMENAIHHEMTHAVTNDTTLPIYPTLKKQWPELFVWSTAKFDFSSSRIGLDGLQYGREGLMEDQATIVEAMFNGVWTWWWKEIRYNSKQSPLYSAKIELMKCVYHQASMGLMNDEYWDYMASGQVHSGIQYQQQFEKQRRQIKRDSLKKCS